MKSLEGLRYDDLYDPMYDLDINEALNRLPREIVDARNQRLKRAMDLSLKHTYLPEDLQVLTQLTSTVTVVAMITFPLLCELNIDFFLSL